LVRGRNVSLENGRDGATDSRERGLPARRASGILDGTARSAREEQAMRAHRWFPLLFALVVAGVVASSAAVVSRSATSSVVTVKAVYNKTLKTTILVDGTGRTLYAYTADYAGVSMCTNDATYHCSKAWPPLRTTGTARAGAGVKASLLTTFKRKDGGLQVQYHGHPLYTDAGGKSFGLSADTKAGDVNGQGFASIWYVVSPKGSLVKKLP
jgi:predicted lipoprotein with Yx(FWY)xxD motif